MIMDVLERCFLLLGFAQAHRQPTVRCVIVLLLGFARGSPPTYGKMCNFFCRLVVSVSEPQQSMTALSILFLLPPSFGNAGKGTGVNQTKKYLAEAKAKHQEIYIVGICFASEEKNITEFDWEKVESE